MKVTTERLSVNTHGAGDLRDITGSLQEALAKTGLQEGQLTVFVVGSTAALAMFEFEDGLIRDMQDLYERLAPRTKHYAHDDTWDDANGFSHVRAALQGQNVTIPFQAGKLLLGTWQQVVLAEFDNRQRQREIVLSFIGA